MPVVKFMQTAQAALNCVVTERLWHVINHPVPGRRYRRGKNRCATCGGLLETEQLHQAMHDFLRHGTGAVNIAGS